MQNNREQAGRQFDGSRTKLSQRFMAGRGQVLLEAINKPLQAQEFAKRRTLQELLFKGQLKLDESNVPEELLPLNLFPRNANTQVNGNTKSPISPMKDCFQQTSAQYEFPSLPSSNDRGDSSRNNTPNDSSKQMSINKPESNWGNDNTQKESDRKDAAKPLRKPDKTKRKPHLEIITNSTKFGEQKEGAAATQTTMKNPWLEWEDNVIVHGSLPEEDLAEIATVEDNDDIHDVVVNQYVDALQNSQSHSNEKNRKDRKITPQSVQQFSKLKSTSNADCSRVLPGTVPNPPKGDNRWGGSQLNDSSPGWGEPVGKRNNYDDGSSVWSTGGSQYGGRGWSNAS